jgi:hypothetical protein
MGELLMPNINEPDPARDGFWTEIAAPDPRRFPVDVLPPAVALFVEAVAMQTQTPVDMAAVIALGVMSAAALGAGTVDCGNWQEELALYLMIALPSGERKSAVLQEVTRPLHALEREWRDAAAGELRELRSRKDVLDGRRAKLVKKASDVDDLAERGELLLELEQLEQELEEIGDPARPRLLADDATPEVLATLLSRHDRLAIFSAEAALMDNIVGRYSDKAAANLHLVCHAYSAEPTRVDRRDREEWLEAPLLTIALAIQPHVLRSVIEHPTARAQGLVGRFAFVLPESGLGRREISPPAIPPHLRDRWTAVVRRLFTLLHPLPASVADRTDRTPQNGVLSVLSAIPRDEFEPLSLSPLSLTLLDELRAELEPRHLKGGDLREIADWTARHPGRVVRIAGLLHLAEHARNEPISEGTMFAALQIGAYLLEHALIAFKTPDERVRRALGWLARHGQRTVSQRGLHRGPLNSRGPAEEAVELAEKLVELDALRPIEAERAPTGQPPSPTFAVNPHLRELHEGQSR